MTDRVHHEYAVVDIESSSPAAADHDEDVQAPLLPLAVSSQEHSDEQLYREEPKYKDRCWAVAFKINVLVTLFSAVWFGTMGIKALMNDSLSSAGRRRLLIGDSEESNESEEPYGHPAWIIFLGMLAALAIVSVVTCGMLQTLYNCGRNLLFTSYIIFAWFWGIVAVLLLLFTVPLMALLPIFICAFVIIAVFKWKQRIAFAAANLKVATMALQSMPWTFRSALLMGVVQFMWCTVAAIAALGSFVALETVSAPNGDSYRAIDCVNMGTDTKSSCVCNGEKISDAECEYSGWGLPLMVIWLLSMSWGSIVLKNVVACTVTGSVASWWFSPNEDAAPVKGAFRRATGSSFGSLCKAAVVHNMGAIAEVASCVLHFVPCASFILGWINNAVMYILTYTIAFIGIYGLDFASAGRRVSKLFQQRGVTTLANNVAVDVGLRVLAFSTAIAYAALSMIAVSIFVSFDKPFFESNYSMDSVEFWSIWGPQAFGIFTCFFMIETMLELARSGYKAVFVCFVQDPDALAQKHDLAVHEHLHAAWIDMQHT